MNFTFLRCVLLACACVGAAPLGLAQAPPAQVRPLAAQPLQSPANQRGISEWLLRMHDASRRRAFIGTLVVSSGGHMASSRIWHVCDGDQQIERVESLSGVPRSTFRRNDQIIIFSPQTKVAVVEKRESLGQFPNFLKSQDGVIEQYYSAVQTGAERVAGVEADVVRLEPRDGMRFGYRVWSEKKTGLAVKLQTLDDQGRILEEVAFSELQLDAPVSMDKLSRMMANTGGYKVETPAEQLKTTAAAEGWRLKSPVPGFRPMGCLRSRAAGAMAHAGPTMQWIFSDGLASVSLFIEAYERRRHGPEALTAMGATHMLTQRWSDDTGEWWLTAVGEVPLQTLQAFAQGIERKK